VTDLGPELQWEERDGLPVVWLEHAGDGHVQGGLVFGTGQASETLPTHGLCHLAEHLAVTSIEPGGPRSAAW
jgi:predicted Zn-dependent peptidase